jgi:L-lactate dehydrogenase
MGEHGDSSISTFSGGTIAGVPIIELAASQGVSEEDLANIHKKVYKKAYEIINRKRATFYGIGNALAEISKSILRNEKKIFAVGTKLTGQYGVEGVYIGIPSSIGLNGIVRTYPIPLSSTELEQFKKSAETLREVTETALEAIK